MTYESDSVNGYLDNGLLRRYYGDEAHVVLPNSVKSIEGGAFAFCHNLQTITLPSQMTEIGSHEFMGASLRNITIPDHIKKIGSSAFQGCAQLSSVVMSDSVTEIGYNAFEDCKSLTSIVLSNNLEEIDSHLFRNCESLPTITIPNGVKVIGSSAFSSCSALTSVHIPDSVIKIGSFAFSECNSLTEITLPTGMKRIENNTFKLCKSLRSIIIPNGVTEIGKYAFLECRSLTSVTIPESVTLIEDYAFQLCSDLKSVVIPNSITEIGEETFSDCSGMESIIIPDTVTKIDPTAFDYCENLTVVCREGSYAHQYCVEQHIMFIFDYQYEAFHGVIPPGIEKLTSPFLADEEKPYIFISYSHRDRDKVLGIVKMLYESGWKIWYDEGLTIGDSYDKTLNDHVKNCAAFLLFVTKNSINSAYIEENEIPWAIEYHKPIIKCILDEGADYEVQEESVAAVVDTSGIEPALEKISGLYKGERREAKGITVVFDPAERDESDGSGYAYCLYSEKNAAKAQTILFDVKDYGGTVYNAVEEGEDEEQLQNSACLIVILDKSFLLDEHLTHQLIDAYQKGMDIAICQTDIIEDDDLPEELLLLHKMQWLNFALGVTSDLNKKLARYLQQKGCVNTAILPGFEYEETQRGIVLKRYTGKEPNLRIEREYGGIPVVKIADEAFKNCLRLKTVSLPDSVKYIGNSAFESCINLHSLFVRNSDTADDIKEKDYDVSDVPDVKRTIGKNAFLNCKKLSLAEIPEGITEIEEYAFKYCKSLTSVSLPNSVTIIGRGAFYYCEKLRSIEISENVTVIRKEAFYRCESLTSVNLPSGLKQISSEAFYLCENLSSVNLPPEVKHIGSEAFYGCKNLSEMRLPDGIEQISWGVFDGCENLSSVNIPGSVKKIDGYAFFGCMALTSVMLENGLKEIENRAFCNCKNLTTVRIPNSVTKIDDSFDRFTQLTVVCSPFSYARRYCKKNNIPYSSHLPK